VGLSDRSDFKVSRSGAAAGIASREETDTVLAFTWDAEQ
jgi:hypothetical protein